MLLFFGYVIIRRLNSIVEEVGVLGLFSGAGFGFTGGIESRVFVRNIEGYGFRVF